MAQTQKNRGKANRTKKPKKKRNGNINECNTTQNQAQTQHKTFSVNFFFVLGILALLIEQKVLIVFATVLDFLQQTYVCYNRKTIEENARKENTKKKYPNRLPFSLYTWEKFSLRKIVLFPK